MSYGLKYIMQWASQNANANNYRIELYQKDYSGEVTEKKLGSAPSLVMDNADNGIMGTSLQFSIQADIDGELQELYTTDAKKFKCLLFKNDKQIWTGYVLQELYSEDYIAAPYDVGVTATDQLALLKDVPYAPIGRKTLLEIIHNAITPTQLELGYSVQTSLKPQLQDSDIPFISFVTIDDGGYINYSCYEVISMIMRTCNMTITQIENSWVIARKSDISAEIFSYDSALNLIGQAEPNALVIGRMYENDIWPVGNLVRKFTAVPKNLKFAFSPIVKSSFFDNPTMEGPEYWQSNGTYIEQAPGKYKVTVNRLEYNYNVNAWILRSSNRKTKDFALWQSIDVEQGGASLSLKVSYCPMLFISPVTTTSAKKVQEAKLTVQIKLETDSAEVYYMTKEGWKSEDAGDLTYTANPVTDDPRQRGNKDQYSSAVINFPAIPANGVLTISFRNDSVNYIKSDASNMEPFYEPYLMGVTDVMLTAPDVVGYDSDVILNAQGNSSVEQELFFSDAYGIGNEEKSLYNFIRIGDSDTSDWLLGKSTFETFFKALVQDTANLANLKNHYSGVISGTQQIGLLYYEKFSGDILRMERGTLDLLTEDLNGEWLQVPVSDAVYDEIELNTNENNVVKPASVSTSIPTGNFASTDALDALTKIVNILNTIIGLDDDDNAYVKPKSDGTPRNFYTYGTMSFGGIDDGESGEGGGTGITSLYDIPEIAVSVATLVDGQSLVYDATLHKWVNRLVQGGSGVDMDYVWAALAGATDEKINASHIPDLSDVYLPLTGGTITGSITTLGTPGIIINREVGVPYIRFQNDADNINGELGVTPAGELVYYPTIESIGGYGKWNKVLHLGNIAQYMPDLSDIYLPLTGGIITGDLKVANTVSITTLGTPGIIINREVGVPYIRFQNDADNINGELGVTTAGELVYYPTIKSIGGYGKWNKVLHLGNIAQYMPDLSDIYLPLAGGIMTGDLKFANGVGIKAIDIHKNLQIGMYQNNGIFLQGPRLLYSPASGTDYQIWHAGNDGSGSGLDADLLDGLDETRFFRRRSILNSYDSASALSLGLYMLGTAESVTDYFPTGNGTFINLTSTDNSGSVGTNYGLQFCANYAADALYVRSVWYNSLKSWKQLAFTDSNITGNAESATKLQTARKIWGRTFNGTDNITSHLELGNSIAIKVTDDGDTLRNALVMDSFNSLLIGSGNVASDAGYMTHIYGKPIRFSISSDNHPVTITSNANVLIGTTTENIAYKLNVVGAARISGTLNLGAGVQIGNSALVSFRSKVTETETEAKYYNGLYLSSLNNFQIGYGTAITGKFKTNLHGYGIDFRSKGTDGATMSLTTGGNVGIGITNPEYKLDVNGTTRLDGKVTLTKDVVLNNYTAIKFKDFDGVELNTIMVGTDNALTIGADHSVKNYETRIKGVGVTLFHGNTQVLSLTSGSEISAKNILPFADDNPYNLGSSDNRWNTIYGASLNLSGNISSGNILPLETNKYTLGSTTLYWANLYTHGISSSPTGGNLLNWYGEGRFWNLMPQTTELHNLGDGDKRWASAHIKDVVAYNSVKIGDATLTWDAVNQCLVVDKNFVSDGSISFGGLEPPTEDDYLATNGGTILGDLGIGNAANTYKNLNMYGSMYFYLNSNPTAYKMQLWMDGNSRLALRNPTDHAATKFYVYGDIIYNGTCGKPSDMRLKHVVEDVYLSSEIIANAPLFRYKRKDSGDDRIYIGSSAQYWQEVAPELTPLVDDYLTLDYETLGVMMGKSNATEIESLKERMKILEAKVENYERILGII